MHNHIYQDYQRNLKQRLEVRNYSINPRKFNYCYPLYAASLESESVCSKKKAAIMNAKTHQKESFLARPQDLLPKRCSKVMLFTPTANCEATQSLPNKAQNDTLSSKAFTSACVSPSPLYPSANLDLSLSSAASPLRPPPQHSPAHNLDSSSFGQTTFSLVSRKLANQPTSHFASSDPGDERVRC